MIDCANSKATSIAVPRLSIISVNKSHHRRRHMLSKDDVHPSGACTFAGYAEFCQSYLLNVAHPRADAVRGLLVVAVIPDH